MTDERLNEIRALAESVAGMNPDEAYASVDRLADAINCLLAVIAERDAEIARIRIGGNHLGLLIGADHPPHTASCDDALEHYGAGEKYEIWCCWKAIMEASHERD